MAFSDHIQDPYVQNDVDSFWWVFQGREPRSILRMAYAEKLSFPDGLQGEMWLGTNPTLQKREAYKAEGWYCWVSELNHRNYWLYSLFGMRDLKIIYLWTVSFSGHGEILIKTKYFSKNLHIFISNVKFWGFNIFNMKNQRILLPHIQTLLYYIKPKMP